METRNYQIYFAPFQGITTSVFREVYTRHFTGVNKLFTPFFTHVDSPKRLSSKEGLSITIHNGIPVVPQILSKDPDEIIRFGNVCHENGFQEINWNLGCPFPRVAHKKRGSGMLPYPDMIRKILDETLSKLPLKLSIKCRLGYAQPEEILALIPVFNSCPISELIIHARIGHQLYKGEVNLQAFEKARAQSQHPIVYNGDIFSVTDFQKMINRFPKINLWMLGRGVLTDPFLPASIKGSPQPEDYRHTLRKYVDDMYFGYLQKMNGRLQSLNVLKEFWSYLSLSFDNPVKVFGKIKKCTSFDAYEDAVNGIFEKYSWVGNGSWLLPNI